MKKENNIAIEEYEKMVKLLGLAEASNESYEQSECFNAWLFGVKKEDCDFVAESSTTDL